MAKKGEKLTSEIKLKVSNSLKGHPVSEETRIKLSNSQKGKKHSEEEKRKIALGNKGKTVPKETREKLRLNSIRHWANPKSRAKILDAIRRVNGLPSHRLKISKAMKGKIPSKSTINAAREVNKARKGEKRKKYEIRDKKAFRQRRLKQWRCDSYVAKQMKSRHIKPNKNEFRLQELLDIYLPKQWKYVGDGQLIIGGRCPDFININGKKDLIELFGNYWHRGENPANKINHYKSYGFRCMVIWENELEDEELLAKRLRSFSG